MPVSTEMAEEQAEPTKKNMKWVKNMAQTQKQYESMQQFNDSLNEKSMRNLKSEYLAETARDKRRTK